MGHESCLGGAWGEFPESMEIHPDAQNYADWLRIDDYAFCHHRAYRKIITKNACKILIDIQKGCYTMF